MHLQRLDPGVLDRLAPTAPASVNRTLLRDAGFFAEPAGAGPPGTDFIALRVALGAVDSAEREIEVLLNPIPWLVGTVPTAVRWGVVATAAVLAIVGGATTGLGTIWALVGTPLVLTPLCLLGLAWALVQDQARRRNLEVVDARRRAHGAALVAAAERLATQTFRVDVGTTRVVSVPHLAWVEHRLRDLRVHRAPGAPPAHDALVLELAAARDRIQAALRQPRPPVPELEVEFARLREGFSALRIPPERSGDGVRLDALLAAGAAGRASGR